MPTLFAIDTAGDHCSLALLHGGRVLVRCGPAGQTHLEHVMPRVEELFAEAGVAPAACDAFAFGSGPGSFTGLRVACTIAQGLAFGTRRPVIAVGNLAALAYQAAAAPPHGAAPRRVLAAIDARMGQAYVAVLAGAGTAWETLLAPALVERLELSALIARWRPDVCAGDAAWLQGSLAPGVPAAEAAAGVALRDARADAGSILALAQEQLARGQILSPEQAAPQYVRDDVARTVAQRRTAMAQDAPS